MAHPNMFQGLGRGRRVLLLLGIVWLALSVVVVGPAPILVWPVSVVLAFLALNALAGTVVVTEFVIAYRPNLEKHHSALLYVSFGLFYISSVIGYLFLHNPDATVSF